MYSCVACGEFTRNARNTRSGLMCPACARFMRVALEDLGPEPKRLAYVPPAHLAYEEVA